MIVLVIELSYTVRQGKAYGASYRLRDHQAANVMQSLFESSSNDRKEEEK